MGEEEEVKKGKGENPTLGAGHLLTEGDTSVNNAPVNQRTHPHAHSHSPGERTALPVFPACV